MTGPGGVTPNLGVRRANADAEDFLSADTKYFAKRFRSGWVLKSGAVFVVVVCIVPMVAYFRSDDDPIGKLLVPLLFILIVCMPHVLNWYWTRHTKIALAVNRHGLWCSGLGDHIRWSAVRKLAVRSVVTRYTGVIFLDVEVQDPRSIRPIRPWLFSLKALLNHAGDHGKLSIPINHLHEPPDSVVAAIREFHPVEGTI